MMDLNVTQVTTSTGAGAGAEAAPAGERVFTCLSCTIAFRSAEEQRTHYHSDHHRYNMKRRLAGLAPLSAAVFDEKVRDRQAELAAEPVVKTWSCKACSKTYTTENAYISHVGSKRHQEKELKAALKASTSEEDAALAAALAASTLDITSTTDGAPALAPEAGPAEPQSTPPAADPVADEEQAGGPSAAATRCLFCPAAAPSLDDNLTHMSAAHSFFVPDADFLADLPGLLALLAAKIEGEHLCTYCDAEFRSAGAARSHMVDKGHCKLAYDDAPAWPEVWDYYDFAAVDPEVEARRARRAEKRAAQAEGDGADGAEEPFASDDESTDSAGDLEDNEELSTLETTVDVERRELVLPSGARLGHRADRRYFAQSFPGAPRTSKPEDPNSGRALVRRLLADKNAALVPRRGGLGAFGMGTDMVRARNAGEARAAGRHVREYRDQRRREAFTTRVGHGRNELILKYLRDPTAHLM